MPTPLNISASRAGSILGMSNYSTPLQVWLQIMESREQGFCEKHNYKIPEFEYNSAMKWGHAFESAVIELAEEKANDKITDREVLFAYDGNNKIINRDNTKIDKKYFMTCHIDGGYDKSYDNNIGSCSTLHEGKTTSAHYFYSAFGEPGTDRVPVEYQLQCQHQMICTGAEKVILSVLVFPKRVEEWEAMGWIIQEHKNPDYYFLFNEKENRATTPENWAKIFNDIGNFHQYTIHAHADLQELMIEAYSDFWNNHVLTGIPPEPKNMDDLKSICREPVGTIIATPEIENLIAEQKQIGSEISSTGTLAKRREQLKVEILNYSRNAGFVEDDESKDKWLIMSQSGKKLAQYSKDKNNNFIFR